MSLLDKFSIQLYSVREETAKDFTGTIQKLSEIGYTGVEFAGYGSMDAKDMKMLLDECHIKSVGSHVGMDRLQNKLDEELEYNHILGTEYVICPYSAPTGREECLRLAEKLNGIALAVNKAGMKFGYHNHAKEFVTDGGEYLLDILFANTENVIMELDMYWAAYAGVDPVEYMLRHSGILRMLHLKQIADYETKKCVDLNEGVLDFKDIIMKAKAQGVEHFILEQEAFAVSAFVSAKNGFDHIMSF